MAIQLGVNGACGRMGQRIVALAHEDTDLELAAALESPEHPRLGADIGQVAGLGTLGVKVASELHVPLDVMIDFSVPEGAVAAAQRCAERSLPLVMATTGLSAAQRAEVEACAHYAPILIAPNLSLAVNLLMKLVGHAAAALKNHPGGADVEIVERHHRQKADAPSGTALRFGQIVAEVMGQTSHVHGRHGRPGARPRDEIGYHALRVGDDVGQHTIVFGLMGETLELAHRAHTRDCYARGALAAAKYLVTQRPGLYSMADVIGL
jgi:4-hydroxy-tetrahydrodipicolinate reductase